MFYGMSITYILLFQYFYYYKKVIFPRLESKLSFDGEAYFDTNGERREWQSVVLATSTVVLQPTLVAYFISFLILNNLPFSSGYTFFIFGLISFIKNQKNLHEFVCYLTVNLPSLVYIVLRIGGWAA